MEELGFIEKAKNIVWDYARDNLGSSDRATLAYSDVYVVWFVKVLQNWKALLSTNLPDGMYYEVTYNGDKGEAYLDAYEKVENVAIPD